ncbi:HAMP domain-containing protein, partial [bacterium]|nr:HAMP domain-containing protein [bacterium]
MTGSRSIFSRIFIVFLLLAIVPVTLSSLLIVASYDGLITQLTDNTIYEQLMPDLRVQTYNLLRDAMILVLVTVAITLTIAVFAALFISRTWGMPIRNLLLAIDQASKGDWNVRVPVRSADEFGELGRGFNLMVRRLSQIAAENQKAHEQLEQRVAERTAELTLAYEALKRSTDKINDANRLKTEFVANMS